MANAFLEEKLKSLKLVKVSKTPNRKQKKHAAAAANGVEEITIKIDPQTDKPTAAWERLSRVHAKHQLPLDTYHQNPRREDALRFVCLSDTHGQVEQPRREFEKRIPEGDVLVHCGDFSMGGDPSEIVAFDNFIGKLPHPVKLLIAGNHEMTFEDASYGVHPVLVRQQLGLPLGAPSAQVVEGCKALVTSMLYLEEESISICGINIYGSPWVPTFGSWGFSARRGEHLLEKWDNIPSNTDILITHGPPCGYGDDTELGRKRAGCVELLNTVVHRVKPQFHVFGHIHTGYGMWTNGTTTFINAAVCNNMYRPINDPIVFDIPLPPGYTRQDFGKISTESLRQARQKAAKMSTISSESELSEQSARQARQEAKIATLSGQSELSAAFMRQVQQETKKMHNAFNGGCGSESEDGCAETGKRREQKKEK